MAPPGLQQIAAPNREGLVIGCVRAEDDADVPAAYGLAQQIQLTPLSQWPTGQ